MAVATNPLDKTDEQRAIIEMVRQFADEQIIPNAEHFDHEDEFPEDIVEQMKELGLFGVTIPEEYGGMGLDLTTYVMIVEELSRGWISISGVINTHFIGSYLLHEVRHRRAEAEVPAAHGDRRDPRRVLAVASPSSAPTCRRSRPRPRSSTTATTRSTARRCGSPTACAPAWSSCSSRPTRTPSPRHKGFTCFIAEKEPGASENTGEYAGLTVPPQIKKMGYKGVESTELVFDGYKCPAENILGGEEAGLNAGFAQMMDALEVGRANVAARGVGLAQRALELALRYSQERKTFGKPIAQHQAIQFKLADMATQVEAARLMTIKRRAAEGRRRALGHGGRAWRSSSPRRPPASAPRSACASTAATATPRSTRSSASTATRRCC